MICAGRGVNRSLWPRALDALRDRARAQAGLAGEPTAAAGKSVGEGEG